ncbi:MAG: ectoine/hydroxyectoine ABC transporter permease subunit EhuD, partial [Kofleriaceae bacterium]
MSSAAALALGAPPVWSWDIARDAMPSLLRGLAVTLQIVVIGMIVALALGLVWAVLRRSQHRLVRWPVIALLELVRSTPLLVQLFFLYYAVLPGIGIASSPLITGALALGLHYSCFTAEVYRAGIEGVPRGQWDAARALHLSRYHTYRHVILPQAIPPIIPAMGNYLIAIFKDTPLCPRSPSSRSSSRRSTSARSTFA